MDDLSILTIAIRIASSGRIGVITIGDVKKVIKFLQKQKKTDKVRDMLLQLQGGEKMALRFLIDLVPGGGSVQSILDAITDIVREPVGGAMSALFEMARDAPDSKTGRNPLLKAFNIDDKYKEMLSPELMRKFIEEQKSEFAKIPDSDPLPNMNKALEKFVQKEQQREISKPG